MCWDARPVEDLVRWVEFLLLQFSVVISKEEKASNETLHDVLVSVMRIGFVKAELCMV